MFSSAELIEALRRRRRRSLRPPPPGEFPPGWRDWFQAMALRPGRVTGARAEDIVAAAAMRKPRVLPAPAGSPGRWRAFGLLWRPGWEPAARDERWVRVTAMSGSLLLHLLLALAAVWLMLIRFHFDAPEAEARDGEEHVLQVEYIGEGTPADAGGGEAGAPAQATAGAVGQTVVFTASGGGGAFRWRVGDSSAGAIEARGANQALYTCLLVGNNSVIVEDGEGHYAAARIVPVADALAVSPASAALSGGAVDVSFAVSGGSPPYVWTSGNPRLGTVSYSEDSSYVAAYRAVAGVYGVNVVTVIDQEGRTLSVTVTQSP